MNEQRMYGNGRFPPGASRLNHKETESLNHIHPAKRPPPPPPPRSAAMKPSGTEMTSSKQQLLAGYMAHEFRTSGTVLGHKLDGDRAVTAEMTTATTPVNGNERYKEITSFIMMKSDGGGHLPAVVNSAQLAHFPQPQFAGNSNENHRILPVAGGSVVRINPNSTYRITLLQRSLISSPFIKFTEQ